MMKKVIPAAILGLALHAGTSQADVPAQGVEHQAINLSVSVFTLDPSEGTDPSEVYSAISEGFAPVPTESGEGQFDAAIAASDLSWGAGDDALWKALSEWGDVGEVHSGTSVALEGDPVPFSSHSESSQGAKAGAAVLVTPRLQDGGDVELEAQISLSNSSESAILDSLPIIDGSILSLEKEVAVGSSIVVAGQNLSENIQAQGDDRIVFITVTPVELIGFNLTSG